MIQTIPRQPPSQLACLPVPDWAARRLCVSVGGQRMGVLVTAG